MEMFDALFEVVEMMAYALYAVLYCAGCMGMIAWIKLSGKAKRAGIYMLTKIKIAGIKMRGFAFATASAIRRTYYHIIENLAIARIVLLVNVARTRVWLKQIVK
ncbi:MAG: hypothetical protein K2F99_08925 [Muribaculaceae bacterium]|nr:hypothetical protein [Muribaculaceae bacterium]